MRSKTESCWSLISLPSCFENMQSMLYEVWFWVTWRNAHPPVSSILRGFNTVNMGVRNLKFHYVIWNFIYQTRNLLRIAIFNISYIRGLFPEKYFNDKSVPALGKPFAFLFYTLNLLIFVVEFNLKLCFNDRDEDQKAYASWCWVSQTDWLDGEGHV